MNLTDKQKLKLIVIYTQNNLFPYRREAIGRRVHNVSWKIFTTILLVDLMTSIGIVVSRKNYAVFGDMTYMTASKRFKELIEKGYLKDLGRHSGVKLTASGQAIADHYHSLNSEYFKKQVDKIQQTKF